MEKLVPNTPYATDPEPERSAKGLQTTLLAGAVVVPDRNQIAEGLVHPPLDRHRCVAVSELQEGKQVGLASTARRS